MADEKTFIINLRREFSKKPIYRRAKKAVTAVKEYISKHLKVKEVKIANDLNMKIWERGRRHPPPKIKVKAIVKEGIAYVQLPELAFDLPKPKDEKSEKAPTAKELAKKEQEKELNKELADEEKARHKKEHQHEPIAKPGPSIKPQDKVVEDIQQHGRVIGSTGKKGAKESKP